MVGARLPNLAFHDGDALGIGTDAEVHSRSLAVCGRAVIAVQVAEQLAETQVQLQGLLEAERGVDRLRCSLGQRRAEVIDVRRTERALAFGSCHRGPPRV